MGTEILHKHEMEHLLEALRRDARAEESLALTDPQWAFIHRFNARRDRRLLELLNPKSPNRRPTKRMGPTIVVLDLEPAQPVATKHFATNNLVS